MNINRNNYEEIFIDYFDGNLSAEQIADLFLFLEVNPELKTEFENFNAVTLESSQIEFPFKNKLKRGEVNDANFSQYMIAFMEGDLSNDEQISLDSYLKLNPSRENDLKLFQSTKLFPGNEIFPRKNELKQPIPFVFNVNKTIKYAIAAILFLSLIGGSYYLFTRNSEKTSVEYAESPAPVNEKNTQEQKNETESTEYNETEKASPAPLRNPAPHTTDLNLDQQNKKAHPVKNPKSNAVINHEHVPLEEIISEPLRIATIDPLKVTILPTKIETQQIKSEMPIAHVENQLPVKTEKYMTVIEALRQASDRTLQKAASRDNDAVALSDESASTRSRVSDLLARGIEKVSNDKVAITSENNPEADRSRFSFSLGKFKIEKDKAR